MRRDYWLQVIATCAACTHSHHHTFELKTSETIWAADRITKPAKQLQRSINR